MDKYRIEGHKLFFHVDRVLKWRKDRNIIPIYVEISPSGSCNHRCIFCAVDFLGYETIFLDTKVIKRRLGEMARLGVKSIMYAGEGEPLLHRDIVEIIDHTKRKGLDIAMSTNGVLFSREKSKAILGNLTWIRFSLNAGTSASYAKVHHTKERDFEVVMKNLADAAENKKRYGYRATIGVQMVLIPENADDILVLAERLRETGADYFTVKPYSKHPFSDSKVDHEMNYHKFFDIVESLKKLETDSFKIVFRANTMTKLHAHRGYSHCLGLPFWSYIDARGDLYACSIYHGVDQFNCGNIIDSTMKEIFLGEKRKAVISFCEKDLDCNTCREVCRMDEINKYLWEYEHPKAHVNFI